MKITNLETKYSIGDMVVWLTSKGCDGVESPIIGVVNGVRLDYVPRKKEPEVSYSIMSYEGEDMVDESDIACNVSETDKLMKSCKEFKDDAINYE